jgi:hypothetical protein
VSIQDASVGWILAKPGIRSNARSGVIIRAIPATSAVAACTASRPPMLSCASGQFECPVENFSIEVVKQAQTGRFPGLPNGGGSIGHP